LIVVGGVDNNGNKWRKSNYDTFVQIWAPSLDLSRLCGRLYRSICAIVELTYSAVADAIDPGQNYRSDASGTSEGESFAPNFSAITLTRRL
jgi:hypothetical protein